jgi:type III pantothenate kinase
MILLIDIGNTHTHLGLGGARTILRTVNLKTADLLAGTASDALRKFVGRRSLRGACLCSVVPAAVKPALQLVRELFALEALQLTPKTIRGVGIRYPKPKTIGQDRLANAVAVHQRFGAPSVVVDFGTAVTFDVVDAAGNYVGGIIAPGLACMTDYLHEKTALLPRIRIRETRAAVGKSTRQAMRIGAVHGYRGLVKGLITELKRDLGVRRLPVVATGGYAGLIARGVPEIDTVRANLTLEGLLHVWKSHHEPVAQAGSRVPKRG